MIFSPHFHFKAFPEKERERESVCARERRRNRTVSRSPGGADLQSELQAAPISSPSSRRRDLAPSRDRDREIAPSRARAVARSRSQIDREIAPSRASAVDREIAIDGVRSRRRDRDLRSRSLMVFYLGLCFPFSFPNTRKYFPENFLKYNQTQRNIFLFRKLAFPENMYFPENVLQQPNIALILFISYA